MATDQLSTNTDPKNSGNNDLSTEKSTQNNDDEVLIMNFDEEWGEDGQLIFPQPICDHVKAEPNIDENDGEPPGVQRSVSNTSRGIDDLHMSQDLDDVNGKLEYFSQKQNESQSQAHDVAHESFHLDKTSIKQNNLNTEGLDNHRINGDCSELNSSSLQPSRETNEVSEEVNIAARDINGQSKTVSENEEVSPLIASMRKENEIFINPLSLMNSSIIEDEDDIFREIYSVPENLPYSITYQAFFTCQQCQFKTIQESDLRQHLAECHVNIVPDVSAMLALHLVEGSNLSENESSGTNIENVDLIGSPFEEKVKNVDLSPGYQFSRSSKPNWSLREMYSSDEEGNTVTSEDESKKIQKRSPILKANRLKIPKNLRCPQCPDIAKSEFDWKIHSFVHTKGTQAIKCLDCNFTGNRLSVWKHMMNCHKPRNFSQKKNLKQTKTRQVVSKAKPKKKKCRCSYCSFVTVHIGYYRMHLKRHEIRNEKVMQCPVCPARYFEHPLRRHIRKWHLQVDENCVDGVYICPKCGTNYSNKTSFQTHLFNNKGMEICSSVNKFRPVESIINQLVPSAILPSFIEVAEVNRPQQINGGHYDACVDNNNTDDFQQLNDGRWQCLKCPHIASTKQSLLKHMIPHRQGLKTEKCSYCDFWGAPRSLRTHQFLKHRNKGKTMGIKMKGSTQSYMCHKCQYKTNYIDALQDHIEKNKNFTKCVYVKLRGRPPMRRPGTTPTLPNCHQTITNQKTNVSNNQDSTGIVTIDLDDVDDTNQNYNNDSRMQGLNFQGVTITPVPVQDTTNQKSPRVSVIQDLRFYRRPDNVPGISRNVSTNHVSNVVSHNTSGGAASIKLVPTCTSTPLKPNPGMSQASYSNWLVQMAQNQKNLPTPSFNGNTSNPMVPEPQTYRCKLCSFITNAEPEMKDHVNNHLSLKHHSVEKQPLYPCQKCKYTTRIPENFASHINANKGKPVCDVVGRFNQDNKTILPPQDVIEIESDDENQGNTTDASSVAVSSNSGKIPCEYCNFKTVSWKGLHVHMGRSHKNKFPMYADYKDSESSTSSEKLSRSKTSRRGPNLPPLIPFKKNASQDDTVDNRAVETDSTKPQGDTSSQKNITNRSILSKKSEIDTEQNLTLTDILEKDCSYCNFKTSDISVLRKHEKSHEFSCQECDFVTDSESVFNSHVDAHIQNHEKAISTLKSLHTPTESSSLPSDKNKESCQTPVTVESPVTRSFSCQDCDYVTGIQTNFFKHRELHIKANEASKVRSLVQYNIQPAAGQNVSIEVFQCKECTYETNRISELQVHQQTHQTPTTRLRKPYSCEHCSFRAIYEESLTRHIRGYHPEILIEKNDHVGGTNLEGGKESPSGSQSDNSDTNFDPNDFSDKDFQPSYLKPAPKRRKREALEKLKHSQTKRRKPNKNDIQEEKTHQKPNITEDSTSKNDATSDPISDLEDLLDQREMYTRDFKKEIVNQDIETSDLENLLDYVDIKKEPPQSTVTNEEPSQIIDLLSDSDEGGEANTQEPVKPGKKEDDKKPKKSKTCRKCGKFSSSTIQGFRFHNLEVHEKQTPHKCPCGYKTFSSRFWKSHSCSSKIKLLKQKSKQPQSRHDFRRSEPLPVRTFKCRQCNFKTVDRPEFMMHIKRGCDATSSTSTEASVRKKKFFKCPLCFYKNEHQRNVESHFSMCHEDDA